MQGLILKMARHRLVTLAAVVVYALLTIPTHETGQKTVLAVQNLLTRDVLALVWLLLSGLCVAALTAHVAKRAVRSPYRAAILAFWLLAVSLSVASVFLFSVNNNEFVHFAQYGLLAVPLFALTGSLGQTVLWGTLTGALDEAYQYAVLHPDWGIPWDLNDFVLDLCGSALGAGIVLALVLYLFNGREATVTPGGAVWEPW
ncbi:MAG: hypothetical protein FJW40_03620 [Acidobacteria bacterium]|nr:hypothetical protein [Acidobacteriota bacterium]